LICGGVLNQIYRYAHRDVVHQVILSSSRPPEIIEIPTGNLSPETTIRAVAATPRPAVMLWNQPLPAGTRLAEPSVRVSSAKNFVAKPAKEQEAAGLVQPSEWTYGLAHALAVGINPRWRPEFKVGDRLALPENFDPTALGWKEDAPAALLARALRSYGAYVVELTTVETGALFTAGSPPPDLAVEELTKLFEHLARVETSSSSEAAPRFLSPAQR
jgi:hypothetical protein